MELKPDTVYTPHLLNFLPLIIGMAIVWFSTGDPIAMLGAFIASIHIQLKVRPLIK